MKYEKVLPDATYAPWLTDQGFIHTFLRIRGHSLVGKYKAYELWTLVGEANKSKEGALIEVGVWMGGTGALIANRCRVDGILAPVYLCDTFTGVVKAGDQDPVYKGGEHADSSREVAQRLLNTLELPDAKILEGVFPDDTANQIPKGTMFKFAHLDVDVYQSTADIMTWLWPRMLPGGIVVFDDYGSQQCAGVTSLVNEICANGDRIFIHNLNGHAIFIKL